MKAQKRRLFANTAKFALTALFAAALAFTGCSSGDDSSSGSGTSAPDSGDTIPVTSLALKDSDSNTSSSVAQGAAVTLTATLKPSTATNKTVLWYTDDESVTLSAAQTEGKTTSVTATVGSGATVGKQVTITAKSQGTPSISATYTITVLQASTITIGDISVTPATLSVAQKSSETFTANVSATEASGKTVTLAYKWTTNYAGLTLANDTTSAVTVTAAKTAAIGTATLTLTVTASADGSTDQVKAQSFDIAVTEGNFYPYTLYKQDFEEVEDISSVITVANAENMRPVISLGEDRTKYAKLDFDGKQLRNQVATLATGLPTTMNKDYMVEFDLKLRGPNAASASGAQSTQFVLGNSSIELAKNNLYSGGYLFALFNQVPGGNNASSPTWYLGLDNSEGTATVNLTFGENDWYHFAIVVDENQNVTATITDANNEYILGSATVGATLNATNTAFTNLNMVVSRAIGYFYFDNLVVKAAQDAIAITTPTITVDPENATIDCNGTAILTAESTANSASTGEAVGVSYAWIVAEDYVTVSGADTATVTLVGKNNTISNKSVSAIVKATPAGGTAVQATKAVTVKANPALLSDIVLSATDSPVSVSAGDSFVITLSGAEYTGTDETEAETAVTYTWESSSAENATVTKAEDGRSATVEGLVNSNGTAVTITVTAKLGNITKTQTYELTDGVTPSVATLSSFASIVDAANTDCSSAATVLHGLVLALTATTNDLVEASTWTWESANTDVVTVAYTSAAGATNACTLTGVSTGTANVTVTADDGNGHTATATIAVTVKEKVANTLYAEDFSSVTDPTTLFTGDASATTLAIKTVTPISKGNNYLWYFNGGTAGKGRTVNLKEDLFVAPASGMYFVEFDAALYGEANYNQALSIYTATPAGANYEPSNYLFKITLPTLGRNTGLAKSCTINGTETTSVTLDLGYAREGYESTPKWYHYKLAVNIESKTATITITDTAGNSVLPETALTITGDSYVFKGINFFQRTQVGEDAHLIDNINIWNYVAAE